MIEKVSKIIEKPQKIKEKALIAQEEKQLKEQNEIFDESDDNDDDGNKKKKKEELETTIIEKAIDKIGILLGIGLGEAGTNVIHQYVGADGEGEILIPGIQMQAIYGFCDIRNFTDVTEILQEEVMVFVNSIAEIVHTLTDKYLGTANKNIGDAFLLVWKLPSGVTKYMKKSKTNDDNLMGCLADISLLAFIKIYAELGRSYSLIKYVKDKRIRGRIGDDFKVRMGFGLHQGWAIEGTIGSYHKVDVSYLSPHVNMASFLEGSTKEYGVPMLLSGQFYNLLSPSVKVLCRKIDVVHMNDGDPLKLYSPYLNDDAIKFPKYKTLILQESVAKSCYQFKKILINQILANVNIGPPLYQADVDVALCTSFIDPEF